MQGQIRKSGFFDPFQFLNQMNQNDEVSLKHARNPHKNKDKPKATCANLDKVLKCVRKA